MSEPTTKCAAAIDLFGLYLAGELSKSQWEWFSAHIRDCASCNDKLLAFELYMQLEGQA